MVLQASSNCEFQYLAGSIAADREHVRVHDHKSEIGVSLPQVEEFKYLGILLRNEGKMECESITVRTMSFWRRELSRGALTHQGDRQRWAVHE